MPPKRKAADPTSPSAAAPPQQNPQSKRVKFTAVLNPVSYAEKQASPRKTRRGTALGVKPRPDLKVAATTAATTTTTTTTATDITTKTKATDLGFKQPSSAAALTDAVSNSNADAAAPQIKVRGVRGPKPKKDKDENSPFLTFRAIPKAPRASAAAPKATRGSAIIVASAPPPQQQTPQSRTVFDQALSEDELNRTQASPFVSSLKKAAAKSAPLQPISNFSSTARAKAPTEKDAVEQVPAPPTPSRRGRGGRTATTRKTQGNTDIPPTFSLPTPLASFAESAVADDAAPVVKPRRGRPPAAAAPTVPAPLDAPQAAADDLAPPPPTRGRGRGGRPRGSTRGRGAGRGVAAAVPHIQPGDDDVFQSPSVVKQPVIQPPPVPALYQQTEQPPVPVAIPRQPKPQYNGPATDLGVKLLKKHVLGKLNGRGSKRLVGFEEEYGHVHHLLEQTVVAGEGNSMLIIGARGVGKSILVDSAISSLQAAHPKTFLTVRLNGFLQTDDKLALREIWRQLGVEMDLEDQGGQPKTSNFADTLTSILALLSHPDELDGGGNEEDGGAGSKTSLSVVFVLDEFDLFVTHPRQTLLYNLFDIAQARKAPIAVLGLTSRIDVVEGLEKRVKSRFSHRSVHLRLPQSLEQFWSIVRSGLEVDVDGVLARHKRIRSNSPEVKYWHEWNERLENLFEQSQPFRILLRKTYALSKDTKAFWTKHCLVPVSMMVSKAKPYLTEDMLAPSTGVVGGKQQQQAASVMDLDGPESRLHILPALTELELSLLIAAARLDIISDTDTCNFNMAYEEYRSLASKVKVLNSIGSASSGGGVPGGGQGGKLWGREVAVGAWEGLGRWEVLVPAVATGAGVQGGVSRDGKMWRVDVGLREIGRWGGQGGGPLGGVLGKWCKEI